MKLLKNFALAAALAAICVLCSSCASKPKLIDTAANNEKLSYSESYTELSEKRTNDNLSEYAFHHAEYQRPHLPGHIKRA